MSLETLLEAVNYVEKKETVPSDARNSQDTTSEMISTSSKEGTTEIKSNSNLKHWRKRAVAQSVLESQKQELGRFDDKCKPIEGTALLQGSTASVSSLKVPETTRVSDTASYTARIDADDTVLPKSSEHSSSVSYTVFSPLKGFTLEGIYSRAENRGNSVAVSTPGASSSQQPDVLRDGHESGKLQATCSSPNKDRQKVPQGAVTRETHNLLEKNRRAHLKECFDNLRSVIPSLGTKKVSNLTILREALKYVQVMKRQEQRQQHDVESLVREKIAKKEKLSQLCRDLGPILHKKKVEEILKNCEITVQDDEMKRKKLTVKPIAKDDRQITQAVCNTEVVAQPGLPRTAIPESLLSVKPLGNVDAPTVCEVANTPTCPVLCVSESQVYSASSAHVNILTTPTAAEIRTDGSSLGFQPWTIPQTEVVGSFKPLSVHTNSALPLSVPGQISNGLNAGLCWQAGSMKRSPISASPSNSNNLFRNLDQRVMSATSHRISSIRAYTNNVPTTAIGNFMDNAPNQLKIVVKHVDSAKQQARVSRPQNARSISTNTDGVSTGSKRSTGRTRTTELVFRPRSSVTPPPPSKIMPYFPRFSVGSGGSPPLTAVLPNQSDGMAIQESEDEQGEQFKVWERGPVSSFSFSTIVPPKRKSTSDSPKGLPLKCHKAATTPSTCAQGTSTSADALQSLSVIPSAVLFPRSDRNNKSVTQVCYSTLMQPVRPTVSSTIRPTTNNESPKQEIKDGDQPSSSLPDVRSVALSISDAGHVNSSFQPPVRCQATTPVLSSPVSKQLPNISTSSNTWRLVKRHDGSQVPEEKVKPSSGTSQPQPQIQYVIPMGYAGMIGPGGTPTMGFSPAVGGFVQLAHMPQGQGWGYMIPQNMVFAPASQNGPLLGVKSTQISKSKNNSEGLVSEDTGHSENDCLNKSSYSWKLPQSQSEQKSLPSSSLQQSSGTVDNVGSRSLQIQSNVLQPQFQLVSPHFQAGGQIMIPMGNNIPGGGFIVSGAVAPTTPGIVSGVRHENSVGYGIPMNIIGYPVQLAGGASMQLTAVPNGALGFQRGQPCGMQTQILTASDGKGSWTATATTNADTTQTARDGEADSSVPQ